jgi:1,4-alpha-glucan branching enzyme
MLSKSAIPTDSRTKVSFELAQPGAQSVSLAGNFNGWSEKLPLQRGEDGVWRTTIDLDAGKVYEFRYVVNENEWVNDPQAEGYITNAYGSANCLVHT